MTWWKGDDKSHTNSKLRQVGCIGAGLHFFAISWCASEETDGIVPEAVVPMLAPELTPKARKALVDSLIGAGLWKRVGESSFEVNDYLDYNPSHQSLEKRREAERKRIADRRGAS